MGYFFGDDCSADATVSELAGYFDYEYHDDGYYSSWDDNACCPTLDEDFDDASPFEASSADRPENNVMNWRYAAQHVGEDVCLEGPVVDMFSPAEHQRWYKYYPELAVETPANLFISLGAGYPSAQRVALVVWGSNRHSFPDDLENQLRSHVVRVRGQIYEYGGVARINLTDPGQITVV